MLPQLPTELWRIILKHKTRQARIPTIKYVFSPENAPFIHYAKGIYVGGMEQKVIYNNGWSLHVIHEESVHLTYVQTGPHLYCELIRPIYNGFGSMWDESATDVSEYVMEPFEEKFLWNTTLDDVTTNFDTFDEFNCSIKVQIVFYSFCKRYAELLHLDCVCPTPCSLTRF